MRYNITFIFLTISMIINCSHKKPDYALGWNFIYFAVIKPAQERGVQCSQPNALSLEYGSLHCIDTKVTEGLIFDSITLIGVKTDTVSPGQSFFCQCGQKFTYSIWKRGNRVEDNPNSTNPSVSEIFYTPISEDLSQQALIYKFHYNQPDNLYCIAKCPTGNFQYQFLKIR